MNKLLPLLCAIGLFAMSSAHNELGLQDFFEFNDLQPSPIASFTEKVADVTVSFGEKIEINKKQFELHIIDIEDNEVKLSRYDSDGSLTRQNIYKYDEQGSRLELSNYNSDGSLTGQVKYKYDEHGNQVESSIYYADGSLNFKTKHKYDGLGNQIEWSFYHADGSLSSRSQYKYDGLGNWIESYSYNSDGSLSSRSQYKYDGLGNQIEWSLYHADGSLTGQEKCEYEYDSYSNWIKKTCVDQSYKFGELQPDYSIDDDEVTIREIEYYE